MFDCDKVVSKDHLGNRYANPVAQLFDRIGFENGLLARADFPLAIFGGERLDTCLRARCLGWRYGPVGSHGRCWYSSVSSPVNTALNLEH